MSNHHRNDRGGRSDRDPRAPSSRETPAAKRAGLNEYFIDGEGISREVLQSDICRFLGAEATCRPGDYNGRKGFKIKALRPFTPEMLEDLRAASRDYGLENRALRDRYRDEVPYEDSETRRRNDPDVSSGHGSHSGGMAYSTPSRDGYPPGMNNTYGTESSVGYQGMSGGYPSGSGYQSGPGYPPANYSMAPNPGAGPAYAGGSSDDPRYQQHYTYAQPQGRDYPPQYYNPQPPSGYGAEPPRSRGEPLPPGYAYRTAPGGHAPEDMPREYYSNQPIGRAMPPPASGPYGEPHRSGAPQYDEPGTGRNDSPYGRQPDPSYQSSRRR